MSSTKGRFIYGSSEAVNVQGKEFHLKISLPGESYLEGDEITDAFVQNTAAAYGSSYTLFNPPKELLVEIIAAAEKTLARVVAAEIEAAKNLEDKVLDKILAEKEDGLEEEVSN